MLRVFTRNTRNTLKISPVTAEPPFTVKTIDCVHQTGPRKAAWHPAVRYLNALTLDVYQVCHCVRRCDNKKASIR